MISVSTSFALGVMGIFLVGGVITIGMITYLLTKENRLNREIFQTTSEHLMRQMQSNARAMNRLAGSVDTLTEQTNKLHQWSIRLKDSDRDTKTFPSFNPEDRSSFE